MPETLNTVFELTVFARPAGDPAIDWREFDHGPGLIHLPPGEEIGVRTRGLMMTICRNWSKSCPTCRSWSC